MNSQRALVLAIMVISIVSAAALFGRGDGGRAQGERVLILHLAGTIQDVPASLVDRTGVITPRAVSRQLARAAADPSIQAVVLRVTTPGGAVAASQEIALMIEQFEKPLVVSMGDQATSGGYYIATAADGIVALPGTTTGSIGVIFTMMNLEGLYERLGIEVEVVKSGEHKDMFQRTLTLEERSLLQAVSDEAWKQFVEAIATGRGLPIDHVQQLATGQIFTGSQALDLGLVDRLGGLDEAIALAAELAGLADPVPYEFPGPTTWQRLMSLSADAIAMLTQRQTVPDVLLLDPAHYRPELRYGW